MHTPKRWFVLCLFALATLALPSTASADITAFLGVNGSPSSRAVKGLSAGAGLLILGFEVEYAHNGEDLQEAAPSLTTFMVNGLVQTPMEIAGMQFYGTVGAGGYHEGFEELRSRTNVAVNVGGGVKLSLIGPLRLRLDYRVLSLKGGARYPNPQRFYAGINLKF